VGNRAGLKVVENRKISCDDGGQTLVCSQSLYELSFPSFITRTDFCSRGS
jgi:hypothetical protein